MTIFYQSQDSRCSKKIKEDASHTFHMIQVCHMCHFSAPLDLHFFILSKSCQGSAAAAVGKFSWEVPVSLEAWHPCFQIIQGMVWHLHGPRWHPVKKKTSQRKLLHGSKKPLTVLLLHIILLFYFGGPISTWKWFCSAVEWPSPKRLKLNMAGHSRLAPASS